MTRLLEPYVKIVKSLGWFTLSTFKLNIDNVSNAVPCSYFHINSGNLRDYDTIMNDCLNSRMTSIKLS